MADQCVYQDLIKNVRYEDMEKLLIVFSRLNRLTATPDCEKAADYIIGQLKTYGIACERYEFLGYFSNPIKSELTIFDNPDAVIPSRPRSFSLSCPEGVTGEVFYDRFSNGKRLSRIEERDWYSRFRGKIVLSWNFYEDYVKKIESYGAIGLIHIWSTEEDAVHEETVGPVWGTPTLDSVAWIPKIPVVGIKKKDGLSLVEKVEREPTKAVIHSWVETKVAKASLPVAWIPGRTKEYVLVSGHYDSWFEGTSDNATGNAVCLEISRVLSGLAGQMERGVKIAWWPGHSNGRYMGSTWFCDKFWQELHDHCIAHINIDSPGSLGGIIIKPRTTMLEGLSFTADLIKEFSGSEPDAFLDMVRGADQSFWGVCIPHHIMYKFEPIPEKKIYNCPGSGGGWWWHTEFDSLDKADAELLMRDVKLHLATILRLACAKRLPADFPSYFKRMKEIISDLDKQSDEAFDFKSMHKAVDSLENKVLRTLGHLTGDDSRANIIIKTVGGELNRLMYSAGSEYDFDNTFPAKPFPGLQKVVDVYRDNTPEDEFLFTLTGFIRQSNRMVNQMQRLEKEVEI